MKKNLLFIITFILISSIQASEPFSIVFVHIGKSIPSHVPVALLQARAFNPDCPIILIANQEALANFNTHANITQIPCESLTKTKEHEHFSQHSRLDPNSFGGLWLFSSERFFYLQELMLQYDLKNVFHLEHDVMLYVNLEELLPIFIENYKGLGITMDNDQRCIPGFIYISNPQIMTRLARFFSDKASENQWDMQIIPRFKNEFGDEAADNLPIITEEYVRQQSMRSAANHVPRYPYQYCKNIELFQSLFDAAALGQYLGGTFWKQPPGFVNESCVFNSSLLSYEWIVDDEGRKVPYATYGNRKFRINNLHIHSKNLWKFASKSFEVK